MNQRDKVFMTFGAVALIAAAGVGGYMIFKPASESATPTVATSRTVSESTDSVSSPTNTSTTVANSTGASYKDGTYTATTSYMVPHGATNSLQATVVVSSGFRGLKQLFRAMQTASRLLTIVRVGLAERV